MVGVPKWQERAYRRRLVAAGRTVARAGGGLRPVVARADARRVGKAAREVETIESALRAGLVPMVPVPLDGERRVRMTVGPVRRRVLALRWAWRQRRAHRLFRERFGVDVVRRPRAGTGGAGPARVVTAFVRGRRK